MCFSRCLKLADFYRTIVYDFKYKYYVRPGCSNFKQPLIMDFTGAVQSKLSKLLALNDFCFDWFA